MLVWKTVQRASTPCPAFWASARTTTSAPRDWKKRQRRVVTGKVTAGRTTSHRRSTPPSRDSRCPRDSSRRIACDVAANSCRLVLPKVRCKAAVRYDSRQFSCFVFASLLCFRCSTGVFFFPFELFLQAKTPKEIILEHFCRETV